MFGIGWQEMVAILVMLAVMFAVLVGAVVAAIVLVRRRDRRERPADDATDGRRR